MYAGDIVGVIAGEENGIPSEDDYWLFRLTRDVFNLKPGPRCQVYGVWLEHIETDDKGKESYYVSNNHEELRYTSFLIDPENNLFIVIEEAYQAMEIDNRQVIVIGPDQAHELTLCAQGMED